MKKTIILFTIIAITLFACRSPSTTMEYYYLKINNTTNHNVKLGLYHKEGDSLLREYFISPKETKFLDTAVYRTIFNDGDRTSFVSGNGGKYLPYWMPSGKEMSYTFDNTKRRIIRPSFARADCETIEHGDVLCTYGTIDTLRKVIKQNIEYEVYYTTTYIVTEDYYNLADTL